MILSNHDRYQLHLIEVGLLGSDPQLAARLGVFDRLSAGHARPGAMPPDKTASGRRLP